MTGDASTRVERIDRDGSVAIRKSRPAAATADLAREADVLRRARHPGVVELLDDDLAGDRPHLLLADAGARTLAEAAPLEPAPAAAVVAAVATTIADLAELGIAHRALRPDHVVLDDDGRPRLCGFGSATSAAGPEDHAADVGALGELLGAVLRGDVEVEPIPERRWRAGGRPDGFRRRALLNLADDASQVEPEQRPSAREWAERVAALATDRPPRRARTLPARALTGPGDPPALDRPAPGRRRPPRTRRSSTPSARRSILDRIDIRSADGPADATRPTRSTAERSDAGGATDPPPDRRSTSLWARPDPPPEGVPADPADPDADSPAGAGPDAHRSGRPSSVRLDDPARSDAPGRREDAGTRGLDAPGPRSVDEARSTPSGGDGAPAVRAGTTSGPSRRRTRRPGAAPGSAADRDRPVAGPHAIERPAPGSWRRARATRSGAATRAAVVALVLGAVAFAFALARTTSAPGEPPTRPVAASHRSASCRPAAPPAVRLPGARCAVTVSVSGRQLRVGGARFTVGEPGDAVAVGDWDCDGQPTPALVRPSTGAVYVFSAWPGQRDVQARPTRTIAGATAATAVDAERPGCSHLVVRRRSGPPVTVPVVEEADR